MHGPLLAAALALSALPAAWAQPADAQDGAGPTGAGLERAAGGLGVIIAVDATGAPVLSGENRSLAVFLHPEPFETARRDGALPEGVEPAAVALARVLESGAERMVFFGAQADAAAAASLSEETPDPAVFVITVDGSLVRLPEPDGEGVYVPAMLSVEQAAGLQARVRGDQPGADVVINAFALAGVLGRLNTPEAPDIRVMTHPAMLDWIAENQPAP